MMADSADDVPVSTEEGVGGTRDTYPAPKKLSVQVERYSGRYWRVSRIHIFMANWWGRTDMVNPTNLPGNVGPLGGKAGR